MLTVKTDEKEKEIIYYIIICCLQGVQDVKPRAHHRIPTNKAAVAWYNI